MKLIKIIRPRVQACIKKAIGISWPKNDEVASLFMHRDEEAIIERIKNKRTKNVAFFCMSISLWKYDTLFKLMLEDPSFNPVFFISPRYDSFKVRKKEVADMEEFCKDKHYKYVKLKSVFLYRGDDLSKYDIDIAFYSQPYSNITPRSYYYDKLKDSLLCYVPYGYLIPSKRYNYASILHTIAWKIFMPTSVSVETASLFASSTSNMFDLGFLGYDMYQQCNPFIWKKEGMKKIVWAPHYSISTTAWIRLSSFLDISDFMVKFAYKYKDTIQIVFKPHPHLYPSLCAEWGEKRTKEYYKKWQEMENTMLCEGDAYPVFKSSDALIHDCASFILDYMFTQKPCLYVSFSGNLNVETGKDGTDAYNAHYHASKIEDIETFIQNIVVEGNDNMQEQRLFVLKEHILPKTGKDASDNIMKCLSESLC